MRHYITVAGSREDAEKELRRVLSEVERGIWRPAAPEPVVETREEPTFHVFASEYVEARRGELRPRSIEALEWALTGHLLPYFAEHKLSAITAEEVDRYRVAKVRDQQLVERPLSNRSINASIQTLGQVLDQALEYRWIKTNPARGKRRRLKAERPRRTWLEVEEARTLLEAAGEHRALLATMMLAGLRVGEACGLRWRNVDLARGRLRVVESKTDAGVRVVETSPDLRDDLLAHKAKAQPSEPDDLVFPTRRGTARDRNNVRNRVLANAIKRANATRAKAGLPAIEGVTNHTLRRTFASLLYEAGASPAHVMAAMGHTSSSLALEVYARKMERNRDTGARMDALLRGADWAQAGTSEQVAVSFPGSENVLERQKAPPRQGFLLMELGGLEPPTS
ncbi:MAG: tyrosine-type recombinase/integrase [Gaiellaceae bacterium]